MEWSSLSLDSQPGRIAEMRNYVLVFAAVFSFMMACGGFLALGPAEELVRFFHRRLAHSDKKTEEEEEEEAI